MTTKAQTCPNRRNELKSTGPQTTKKELRKNNLFFKTNPILRKSQMKLTSFNTGKYVKLDTWSDGTNKPNQTQFEPNSNPICKMTKMNVSSFLTGNYKENPPRWLRKNKPNQTQYELTTNPQSVNL